MLFGIVWYDCHVGAKYRIAQARMYELLQQMSQQSAFGRFVVLFLTFVVSFKYCSKKWLAVCTHKWYLLELASANQFSVQVIKTQFKNTLLKQSIFNKNTCGSIFLAFVFSENFKKFSEKIVIHTFLKNNIYSVSLCTIIITGRKNQL